MFNVIVAETAQVHCADSAVRHQGRETLEPPGVLGADGSVHELVGQGRDVSLVDEAGLAQHPVGYGCRRRRRGHGTDVDEHVEEAETGITPCSVLRRVVEVSGQHLQVALEQAGSDADEQQRSYHRGDSDSVCRGGYRESCVAQEHYHRSVDNALSIAYPVGDHTAYDRHEICDCDEDGVNLSGQRGAEAELRLEKHRKDGDHRVVAEAFACRGKRQSVQSFRLSFEHISGFLCEIVF